MIWDGAPIHHCQTVKDFLAAGAAARLQLERLPGYTPDLNADEGVWNHIKRVELRNRCCQDLDELGWELGLAIRRLRRKAQREQDEAAPERGGHGRGDGVAGAAGPPVRPSPSRTLRIRSSIAACSPSLGARYSLPWDTISRLPSK